MYYIICDEEAYGDPRPVDSEALARRMAQVEADARGEEMWLFLGATRREVESMPWEEGEIFHPRHTRIKE